MNIAHAPERAPAAPPLNVFDPGQLYTVAQVVERTQIGRSSLYQAMKDGHLPYLKKGESRRIWGADLDRYLARFYITSGR